MRSIDSNLFDWQRKNGRSIIDAHSDASELGWPPGMPWPREFIVYGPMGECVMNLDPAGATQGMQTYLGVFNGETIRVVVWND